MIRDLPSIVFVLFTVCAAFALEAVDLESVDYVTYFLTTDKSVVVSWDGQSAATYYEVRLYHVEREAEEPAGSGRTETNSITFQLPRSGHFIAKVRACIDESNCSAWSESIDADVATVNGLPRAWWLYGHVAVPGGIIMNEGD